MNKLSRHGVNMADDKNLSDHLPRDHYWQDTWSYKAKMLANESLHVVDGYHFLSENQYDTLVARCVEPLGLKPGDSLLEVGCGSGAFLQAVQRVQRHNNDIALVGVDYSPDMIKLARVRLPSITFDVGDIRSLKNYPDNLFHVSATFGVLYYLNDEVEVRQACHELLRVTRLNGVVLLADIADAKRRKEAMDIRKPSGIRVSFPTIFSEYFPLRMEIGPHALTPAAARPNNRRGGEIGTLCVQPKI